MGKEKTAISIFWHRRDLRLADNAGAYEALKGPYPVLPLFIFDKHILDKLADQDDARVTFIQEQIQQISARLEGMGSSILIKYGFPEAVWENIVETYDVKAVYTNRDYEPYALDRDQKIEKLLGTKAIPFHTYKDHVIFEKTEVEKKGGGPYTVFTPYSRQWKEKLKSKIALSAGGEQISYYLKPYPNEQYFSNYLQMPPLPRVELEVMGFKPGSIDFPENQVKRGLIKTYDENRNFPAQAGTSRLGIHFRFGTISIRDKASKAKQLNETFLNELIWRDFYAQILANFPHVVENAFRAKYDRIEWRNNESEFEAWCQGKTGYPIVDAGMRELNHTGFMHNRVRMITASFLTKHLLIDWRWGEAYFARKLLDFDLASNNGGWQWAAGSGTDAAPYFRIFNPYTQREKFDKNWEYVKQWVPEVNESSYPDPIVNHKEARVRCLATYKAGLDGS